MPWLLKWVSHHLACNNYRFPLWFFTRRLPQQPCSGSAEMLSQGFKSEAAQPFPALWRIFPLALWRHGNLAMVSLPWAWRDAAKLLLFSVRLRVSPLPVSPSAQREVAWGCVLAVGLPAPVRGLKELNWTKVIFWQLCARVSLLGHLQTRVKLKGFKDKTCSSASTILEN